MKKIKLVGAGLLLILIAMFLLGSDSPLTWVALVAGIIFLFMGIFPWAGKLHWFVALAIGAVMIAASWLPGICIPLIVKDRYPGDELNEFLAHLISCITFFPGIIFMLAGIARLFRWPILSWKKREILMRYRLHGKTTPANQKTTMVRPPGNRSKK